MTLLHHGKWPRLFAENALIFFQFFVVWHELSVTSIRGKSTNISLPFAKKKKKKYRFSKIPHSRLDDFCKFGVIAGVVLMCLQMNAQHHLIGQYHDFAVGYLLCFVSLVALHTVYSHHLPRSRIYCRRRITLYFLAIGILAFGYTTTDQAIHITVLLLVAVLILYMSINSFREHANMFKKKKKKGVVTTSEGKTSQMSIWTYERITQRWGLFIILTIGESILALITSFGDFDNGWRDYVAIIATFGIMFCLKDIYIQTATVVAQDHALKFICMSFHFLCYYLNNMCAYMCTFALISLHPVVWTVLHGLLAYLLMLVGISWKLIFQSLHNEVTDDKQKPKLRYLWMLGICISGAIFTMYGLRFTHNKFLYPWWSYVTRIPLLVAIPIGVLFLHHSSIWFSLWALAWTFVNFVVDNVLTEVTALEVPAEKRGIYKYGIQIEAYLFSHLSDEEMTQVLNSLESLAQTSTKLPEVVSKTQSDEMVTSEQLGIEMGPTKVGSPRSTSEINIMDVTPLGGQIPSEPSVTDTSKRTAKHDIIEIVQPINYKQVEMTTLESTEHPVQSIDNSLQFNSPKKDNLPLIIKDEQENEPEQEKELLHEHVQEKEPEHAHAHAQEQEPEQKKEKELKIQIESPHLTHTTAPSIDLTVEEKESPTSSPIDVSHNRQTSEQVKNDVHKLAIDLNRQESEKKKEMEKEKSPSDVTPSIGSNSSLVNALVDTLET
ncbi:hypothetical protein RFI_24461 [Reticulomyxa filosa]|uniref:Uncharacterized protein n=1 Tax=Reticulomyxa filosa TaxID=46433 RepID=X6MGB6_RETFI|nr:hypothetical protein RFI_24461 [Reticulomyxa filosa]|eukprot:ETO12914.1 hypothetical protein RFI_24461 [Reticulomyxa filosa]